MRRYTGGCRVSADKIEFVRTNVPDYNKINPYLDRFAVQRIKELLCANGFYKNPPSMIMDTAIQNIICEAQDQKPFRHTSSSARKLKTI